VASRSLWPRLYCGRARGQIVTLEKTDHFHREDGEISRCTRTASSSGSILLRQRRLLRRRDWSEARAFGVRRGRARIPDRAEDAEAGGAGTRKPKPFRSGRHLVGDSREKLPRRRRIRWRSAAMKMRNRVGREDTGDICGRGKDQDFVETDSRRCEFPTQ